METNNQNPSQQLNISITLFWNDEDELVCYTYNKQSGKSEETNTTFTGVAIPTIADLRFLSKRSSNDNGEVLRVFARPGEYKVLPNGDLVVENAHYSRFQPKGLEQ